MATGTIQRKVKITLDKFSEFVRMISVRFDFFKIVILMLTGLSAVLFIIVNRAG